VTHVELRVADVDQARGEAFEERHPRRISEPG
jgi:hypothetical protein